MPRGATVAWGGSSCQPMTRLQSLKCVVGAEIVIAAASAVAVFNWYQMPAAS